MMFKIKQQPTRLARSIRWAKLTFLVIGTLALTYCATVLIDQWALQTYQTWRFERALKNARQSDRAHSKAEPLPADFHEEEDGARNDSLDAKIVAGSPIGRIEISSIGIAAMVMEGTDGKTLSVAVGHVPGTPVPGQQGNVVLAAHRDTFFRGLRKIRKDDEIVMTTLGGSYHYVVDSTQVVDPDDIKELAPTPDDFLTLVTCYPFYFVGPAPKRFIVRARLASE
jgi:sortase A